MKLTPATAELLQCVSAPVDPLDVVVLGCCGGESLVGERRPAVAPISQLYLTPAALDFLQRHNPQLCKAWKAARLNTSTTL